MGFLHKLWDETLAGPAPESGLGKLRKYNSFSAVRSANHPFAAAASRSFHHRDRHQNDGRDHHLDYSDIRVSRSITILRTKSVDPGSGPSSPTLSSGSSSPVTRESSIHPPSRKSSKNIKANLTIDTVSYRERCGCMGAAGTPRDLDVKRFTRKKQTLGAMEHAEPSDSTAYDWFVNYSFLFCPFLFYLPFFSHSFIPFKSKLVCPSINQKKKKIIK
ncbi:hypothetical protein Cgig2_025202 [Carnegiea gigantea]|uniref:Uncharacterized protein n=1 Tax=Carnegiea gigantea TaxID=171969 RepID=A0A9Q1KSW8_9CARY|nr:hypothetical protein Cgig2_025202 [Carnegiea gigantea]